MTNTEQTKSLCEFLEPKTIWVYTKNELRVTSNERRQMWVDEFGFTESKEQGDKHDQRRSIKNGA